MIAAERLTELIRIPTVSSHHSDDEDNEVFARIPGTIAELYPSAHRAMERELIGDRGILYCWKGSIPSLEPVLGMAHFDVVPPGDVDNWVHPPFSGKILDGRIHGRGSLDDKGMLASWMEAVDRLVLSGYQPCRTFYLAFGGDEETTGCRGAGRIAETFAERGIRFAMILDEGGAVTVDQMKAFTDRPVAMVGIAEKGYLTLRLSAKGMSGHASSPPKHSAIGRLAAAVSALEKSPSAPRLTEAPAGMLKVLGSAGRGVQSWLLRHPGIFGRILCRVLAADLSTAPLVRTTLAPTLIHGGERANVLPGMAEAMVNLRLLPGDTVDKAHSRVEKIISGAVDEGVDVSTIEGSASNPIPASRASGTWWELLGKLARKHFPGALISPYLMTGTTDSRWYQDLSERIYRFIPMEVNSEEASHVHAANESISLASWEKSVDYMQDLLSEALKEGME